MKKVGIATLFGGENYGNVLQNYAVQKLIQDCGFQAVTLNNRTRYGFADYTWRGIPSWRKLTPSHISAYCRTKLQSKYGCKNDEDFAPDRLGAMKRAAGDYAAAKKMRTEKFQKFRSRYMVVDEEPITAQRWDLQRLGDYAAFVCGSDQVWNPFYAQVSPIDFLRFAPKHKRIALAPSFGIESIPEARREDFSAWLREIPHLSVREEAGQKIIAELTGKNAPVLIDPTLCLTAEEWAEIETEPANHPTGDFVFCYFLGNRTRKYTKWIQAYASGHGCQVVDIAEASDLRYYACDPGEFVWLIRHAKAVFTDSFHGTAFSINLKTPFVVFQRKEGGKSMFSRISTLLRKTKLEEREFGHIDPARMETVDFTEAHEILAAEREREIAYLSGALREAEAGTSVLLADKYHCTGCAACVSVCGAGAITMIADGEGFCYPHIDEKKCVQCHACERACPADKVLPLSKESSARYAWSKDSEIRTSSSSGGVFTELARQILSGGGVVYGAAFDENFQVVHQAAHCDAELAELKTSKYVQSSAGTVYAEVKKELFAGKSVLFTGTPCQIAGLKTYLGKDYDNLFTQDIICHGVPSPGVWQEYLNQYHRAKEIRSISFRDKTAGWNRFSMKVNYSDGSEYRVAATEDPFERAFLANINLRPSCHQCQYKTVERVSDLTLADYWGVEAVHPELGDDKGVSLLVVHSEKGKQLLEMASESLCLGETSLERSTGMNHACTHSVPVPKGRRQFFAQYKEKPMHLVVKASLKKPLVTRIRRFVIINGSRVKRLLRAAGIQLK